MLLATWTAQHFLSHQRPGFLTPGASAHAGPSVWSILPLPCSQLGHPSSSKPLQMAQTDTPVLSSLLPTHFAHPSIIRTTKAAARSYSAFGQSRKRHPYLKMLCFICWKTLGIGVSTRDIYNVQGVSPGGAHTTPELPLWGHFHVPGTVLGRYLMSNTVRKAQEENDSFRR